jgi:hypothetical protein
MPTFLRLGSVGASYDGLAVFSCIAGVMLWRKKPKSVSVAKGYLLIGGGVTDFSFPSAAPRGSARQSGSCDLYAAGLCRGLVLLSGSLSSGKGHLRRALRRSSNLVGTGSKGEVRVNAVVLTPAASPSSPATVWSSAPLTNTLPRTNRMPSSIPSFAQRYQSPEERLNLAYARHCR